MLVRLVNAVLLLSLPSRSLAKETSREVQVTGRSICCPSNQPQSNPQLPLGNVRVPFGREVGKEEWFRFLTSDGSATAFQQPHMKRLLSYTHPKPQYVN